MSAGTAYSKRFPGGFVDLPSQTTPVDQQFLNAVETALLQLLGAAPTADAQVMQWDNANTRFGPALLLNKNIDPAAAISKSKLDFTGANGIVDADVAGAAGIQRSKLNFGSGLVNADIAATAAIVISKLAGYPADVTKFLRGDGTWANPLTTTIIRGIISGNTGATVSGSGFSSSRSSAGVYTITFTSPFSTTPVVIVSSSSDASARLTEVGGVVPGSATVRTFSSGGAATDLDFNFVAIGT